VNHPPLKIYAALAAALLMWAASFPAVKVAMASFGPAELALFRFAISTVALMAYANHRGLPQPDLADMPRLAIVGLLCVTTYQLGLNYGMQTVSSGPAAVLVDSVPLWAGLISAWMLKERIGIWGWAGLLLGFAGAVLIAMGEGGGGFQLDRGVWLLLMAAIAFALSNVVQKPLLPKYGAVVVTAWSFLFGTLGLIWAAPGLLPQVEVAPRAAMLWVLFLAVAPGMLAYLWWNVALAHLPVAVVSSCLYLIPPLTFLIAWIGLGEVPGLTAWIGGAVALAGVALVQYKGRST